MIGKESTDNFLAETEMEESLMLMGKVNALRGLWAVMPGEINAKMVNAIFNFGPEENEELAQAKKDKELYWGWYMSASHKVVDLQSELEALKAENKEVATDDTIRND